MNIVLRGQDGVVEQARRQLEDLVPVWVVLDYSHSQIVERELLLAKVSILGPEHFHELLAHHREDLQAQDGVEEEVLSYYPCLLLFFSFPFFSSLFLFLKKKFLFLRLHCVRE